MIEYITQTGAFGVLWILTFGLFLFGFYRFVTRDVDKIVSLFPLVVGFIILHVVAVDVLSNTNEFVHSLIMIRDAWFLMGPAVITFIMIVLDKDLFNIESKKKKTGD